MQNAVCKFCGQYVAADVPEGASEEKILKIGTMNCNCAEASSYQKRQHRAEKAKIELDGLLSRDDDAHNIKAVPTEVRELLKQAIDLIAEDYLHKINVGICLGGTVDIKAGTGGKISVKRSVTLTNKREVE